MAIDTPADVNVRNISGVWTVNKSLSENTDDMLRIQGIGFLARKAALLLTMTATLTQWTDETGAMKLKVLTETNAGLRNEEVWDIDGQEHEKMTKAYGMVKGRVSFKKLDEIEHESQKQGWADDCEEFLETIMDNEKSGWIMNSISGFAVVDGIRRNVRRVVVQMKKIVNPDKDKTEIRLIYDWVRPLPSS